MTTSPMKAYHFVLAGGKAVDTIQSTGTLFPALYRLNPATLQEQCEDIVEQLSYAVERDPEKEAPVEAVKELIDDRIGELYVAQEQHLGEEERTKFQCDDLLAGDLGLVFLSLKEWAYEIYGLHRLDFKPNGFVFDAQQLLKHGALIRNADLLELYSLAMTDLIWHEHYDTVTGAKKALLQKLDTIQRLHQFESIPAGGPPLAAELVFPGPIPVEWAIEVWKDGVRTDGSFLGAKETYRFGPPARGTAEYVNVTIDPLKLDPDWANDERMHIGPGGTGAAISTRYEDFGRWVQKGLPIEPPTAYIDVRPAHTRIVHFGDGRHRFAWLRDHDVRSMEVSFTREQADLARELYAPDGR